MVRYRVAGIALVLLVGAYAAAGYWLAPRLIHDTLVERGREAGFDVRIEKIATHPFALAVELHELRVSTLKGERILYVQRAAVDLSAASAFSHAWIVQRLALEQPVVTALPSGKGGGAQGSAPAVEMREATITDGVLQLPGAPRVSGIALNLHGLKTFGSDLATYQANARLEGEGRLSSEGTVRAAPFAAQGKLEVQGAAIANAWQFLPRSVAEAPKGRMDGSSSYRFANGRLTLEDFQARAALPSGGTLRASGGMDFSPFRATLDLQADNLPLALVQPLIEKRAAARIESGTLSGKGRLGLGGKAPSYDGSLTLGDARVVDAAGNLLFGWQSLATEKLALQFSPFLLQVENVAAEAPRARVAIDEQGRLNLAQVLAPATGEGSGERARIQVGRVRIEQGRVEFSDRSLPSPFGTTVRELGGTVAGISTTPGEAARVRLDGRVGEYGEARVRGTVDLDAPTELTNITARLRNLALPDFTPYAAKFAGYRIKAGRLDGELRYRVTGGRLVGSNELVFRDLQLGEKVESASALDLPIELAVALLTDSEGRINLAIPVSGNLNDPHFDAGGLIAKALGNTLSKIVSTPFRLLASLVGGAQQPALDAVRFAPGSARLSPPEEETVATLARALTERPGLELAIHAGYDAEADAQALRRQAVLSQLAARVGSARAAAGGSQPANPGDSKITAAAEEVYRTSGASADDLARLEPKRPGYGRRLIDALAAPVPLDPEALPVLAQSRARTVRQALLDAGADAERVAIDSAREADASEAGVPTEFELRSR
jgi:hypothetical protein